MQINITYDASAANAPAGFKTAVEAAVQFFETTFTTPITVNITFGWGTVGGQPMDSGAIGESVSTYVPFSYVSVHAALTQDAVTPYAQLAAHFLPASDPTNGGVFELTSSDAKALGLAPPTGAAIDGSVGLDASAVFSFDPNNRGAPSGYDAIGVLEHEISEVLGRQSTLGFTPPTGPTQFGILDLFRYPSAGQLNPTSPTGSFSVDGHTLMTAFNNPANGGDSGDWSQGLAGDAFDAFADQGLADQVSATDLAVMEVLGYHQAHEPPSTPIPSIAPITFEAVTQNTTVAQGQTVYFYDTHGFRLDGAVSGPSPSLTNSGVIVDIGASSDPLTDDSGSFFTGSTITNSAGGAVYSEAINGDAWGHYSGSWSPNLLNQGLIQVVSLAGDAYGVQTWDLDFQFVNASTGTLTVWAQRTAVGLDLSGGNNGGSFTNSGDIEVTGASAIGVRGATTFINSGTIHAVSLDPSKPSIGVDVYEENAPTYTNSGTITADYSFFVDPSGTSPASTPPIDLINTGKMVGAIRLGAGANQIHNTGAIIGDIRFGDANSTYDGAGGHLTGDIFLGHGVNTVTLGADNGVVYGGGGTDTITGGAGNDFIEIGRGNNTIDGGSGFNTLSFADCDTGVTVDLGAGTASAAGADTIKNIQEVIGSSFNDTLKAGVAAATLVAGSGHDTLIGGAGNDTLVAGAGGDVMTGGAGQNTFIYSAGDHQLVITDFSAGNSQDVLKIYGYASAASVTQQGSDTLITLSASDTILLQGVQASSLTSADLSYSAAPYQAPPVPPTLPIFGTTPITFTYDLTIYAGETINETGQPYGLLASGTFTTHSLDNFGAITVTGAIGDLYGLEADPGAGFGGVLTNEAGATFTVSNTGGPADGLYGPEWGQRIVNSGMFSVSATGDATGVYAGSLTGPALANNASGVFSVTSSGGSAYGFNLPNGGSLTNDGQIAVTAIAKATGFYAGRFENDTLTNTGTIKATSTGGDATWGIVIAGIDYGAPGHASITNSGLISAQTAILDEDQGFSPPNAPSVAITNSGKIVGDINLGGSVCSVVNTGVVQGDILLHDDSSNAGGDTIDLRGGSFTGFIAISPGFHGDAPIHDTIYSGADPTLIKVAGGESQLTVTINGAVGGSTTVRFDIASTQASEVHNADGSWTVNAGTDGTETLFNVETLQFTDRTLTLHSGGWSVVAPQDFDGDGKSDLLFGQTNGTLAVWEMSGTSIVGGGAIGAPGGTWAEKGVGDFVGDGHASVLFQDGSGNLAIWEMNGTSIVGGGAIGNPGGTWAEKGVGDFNGDGKADILFQDGSGNLAIWEMNGTAIVGGGVIGNPGGTWHVDGVGDFNGDGKADILFQDASGNLAIWEMNGTSIVGGGAIGNPGGTWAFKGIGDFNGDGKSDILFEDASGQYALWEMNGTQMIGGGSIGNPGGAWSFAGIGDYNGDGHADILFQDASGNLAIWEMSDTHIIGGGAIGNPGAGWHIIG